MAIFQLKLILAICHFDCYLHLLCKKPFGIIGTAFYRLDAPTVAQPPVWKHWMEFKAVIEMKEYRSLASSFRLPNRLLSEGMSLHYLHSSRWYYDSDNIDKILTASSQKDWTSLYRMVEEFLYGGPGRPCLTWKFWHSTLCHPDEVQCYSVKMTERVSIADNSGCYLQVTCCV